jgi:hypothetical protein
MAIFNGQDKNRLIDYFFESIRKYEIQAQTISSRNQVTLKVGGNSIVINNNRKTLINERNILIR